MVTTPYRPLESALREAQVGAWLCHLAGISQERSILPPEVSATVPRRSAGCKQCTYCIVGGVAMKLHGIPRILVSLPILAMQLVAGPSYTKWMSSLDMISISGLIEMKRATGRAQDLADVALLERLREQQQ